MAPRGNLTALWRVRALVEAPTQHARNFSSFTRGSVLVRYTRQDKAASASGVVKVRVEPADA